MNKAHADENNVFGKSDVKIQLVNLEPNKNYTFKIEKVGEFPFVCEAGGIIAGENVNGEVQNGKVNFKAGDVYYEGAFVSATNINANFQDL